MLWVTEDNQDFGSYVYAHEKKVFAGVALFAKQLQQCEMQPQLCHSFHPYYFIAGLSDGELSARKNRFIKVKCWRDCNEKEHQ